MGTDTCNDERDAQEGHRREGPLSVPKEGASELPTRVHPDEYHEADERSEAWTKSHEASCEENVEKAVDNQQSDHQQDAAQDNARVDVEVNRRYVSQKYEAHQDTQSASDRRSAAVLVGGPVRVRGGHESVAV